METNKIIEGNRLIAEFMGSFENPRDKEWMIYNPSGQPRKKDDALYHSSFDWLIPVVEKIEKNTNNQITILGTTCKINNFIHVYMCNSKIEATWLACVEFIKHKNIT
jgi:hypothetical protein